MPFPAVFCLGFRDWYLDHFVRCLDSIRSRTDAAIVVADLGSRHFGAVRAIGRDFGARVVSAPREVWSRSVALNVAAASLTQTERVRASSLIFTDADMILSEFWFSTVGRLLGADGAWDPGRYKFYLTPSRDLPPFVTADLGTWWMPRPSDEVLFGLSEAHPSTGEGAAMIVPYPWFVKVGGFDEAYDTWGAEDNDLVLRARWDGLPVEWLPDPRACAYHQHHNRIWPTDEQFERVRRNRAYLKDRIDAGGPIIRNQKSIGGSADDSLP